MRNGRPSRAPAQTLSSLAEATRAGARLPTLGPRCVRKAASSSQGGTRPSRGANGGANGGVAGRCRPSCGTRKSLKTRRPAPVCAGRAGLRIESSTTELRWRPPNLATGFSTRYSLRLDQVTLEQQSLQRHRNSLELFALCERDVGDGAAILQRRDRKSTRLNSSHDQISYAVFC